MYVFGCIDACKCSFLWLPEEGSGSPETGVTASCERSNMGAESSARAARVLDKKPPPQSLGTCIYTSRRDSNGRPPGAGLPTSNQRPRRALFYYGFMKAPITYGEFRLTLSLHVPG